MGEPGEIGPERDRLGGVEAVLQAAAGDQGQAGRRAVGGDQRLTGRDAPLGKGERELDLLGALAAEGLDAREAGAAQAGDVDRGHAGGSELTPNAMPTDWATSASRRLMSPAAWAPPVMLEIRKGSLSGLLRNVVDVSIASRSSSGSA